MKKNLNTETLVLARGREKTKYVTDGKRHLVCIPYSIENLHAMATDLNIGRHWFHNTPNLQHYDIPKKRMDEITSKCTLVSSKDIVKIIRGTYDRTDNSSRNDLQ